MKIKSILFGSLLMPLILSSQTNVSRAYLGNDGEILSESYITYDDFSSDRQPSEILQMAGFPKKVPVHPNFKNFRNVTLADINNDGKDEILIPSMNTLRVFTYTGELLWSKLLTGTPIYPPSVSVMDGSGTLGIVQVTGGSPNNGRVYYLDVNGNDISGWPLTFNNHWIICAPVIADADNDGTKEIIVQTRTSNNLHVLKTDGTVLWTATLGGTPAVTPSVADIDSDGIKDIVTAISNGTMYAFNANDGTEKTGFPIPSNGYSFSYQSPLLADLDGNGQLSIIGAAHGDAPEYFVRNSDGSYRTGWPVPVPGNDWTYAPPTVVDLTGNNNFSIFTSKPIGEDAAPMLFGYHPDATMMDNFPIVKSGGLESTICVADITGDGNQDLIFGSNLMVDLKGFIHAYRTDGTGEINGFPLRPTGFTFMNGPTLGDVNGDGLLDLVSFSYELTFTPSDSAYVNVYELLVPVEQADVLFGTYKGSNDRSGYIARTNLPIEFPAPLDLTYAINYTDVDLQWLSPDLSGSQNLVLTGYNIYRNNSQIGQVSAGTLTFTDPLVPEGGHTYGVTAVYGDPLPGESSPVEVFVDYILNTPAIAQQITRLYPNPVNGYLTIESPDMTNICVFNMMGELVYNLNLGSNSSVKINTGSWDAGMYNIRILGPSGVTNHKFSVIR
ncbi:MAG: T9SS type A sorting domain-containing protein [Lentimicrobiaceae bacterium]|nr:T9SS type A sorting domain-containing protein [Lentimicrobiaceae bacterium]